MPGFISDSPLARELIRIGEEAIATEDDDQLRAYFKDDYVFHGPSGDWSFRGPERLLRLVAGRLQQPPNRPRADHRRRKLPGGTHCVLRRLHRHVHLLPYRTHRAHRPAPRMGSHRHVQVRRRWAPGRGVGADRLPQLFDQARRNYDGVLTPGIASAATVVSNEFYCRAGAIRAAVGSALRRPEASSDGVSRLGIWSRMSYKRASLVVQLRFRSPQEVEEN
jgi:hypothetical protein